MKSFLVVLLFFNLSFSTERDKTSAQLLKEFHRTIFDKPDSSFYFVSKAFDKAKQEDNRNLISESYYSFGLYYYYQGDVKKSKINLLKAISIGETIQNDKIILLSLSQLGLIEMDNGEYDSSLKLFIKALRVSEKNKYIKEQCGIMNRMGILYELQKDTLNAIAVYKDNIKIAQKNKLKEVLLYNYTSLGIITRKSNKPKSISFYKSAYKIAGELKDAYQQTSVLINLSEVYMSIKNKDSLKKSFDCLQEAKKMSLKMENKDHLFYIYSNMAAYLSKIKDFEGSLVMCKKALDLSDKGIDVEQKINLYKSMSSVYEKLKKYKEAYFYQKKYHSLQDDFFSVEKNKAFNEIQTKYEVDKKNLKIQLLTKEKIIEQNRRKQIFIIGLLIIIALLLTLFFYKNRVKTQKIISEKENEIHKQEVIRLEQEKELKRIVGLVEGQDQERNRIAKEIHDGIGGALAGIKLELSQYNSELKSEKIDTVVSKMSKAFADLRLISHNLSLNSLKDKNLENLLMDLKNEYENRGEFQVELVVFPPNSINKIKESAKHQIYRVIQELLSNVSKHAKAKTVILNFTMHDDFFNIIVEDDGSGFNYDDRKGIGLSNIAERLSSVEAVYTIESCIGKGTVVTIDIPTSQL